MALFHAPRKLAAAGATGYGPGALHRALHYQEVRKERYGRHERRGSIPKQISIEQRSVIVDSRKRFGDWECDLFTGASQQQALVILNERKIRQQAKGQ